MKQGLRGILFIFICACAFPNQSFGMVNQIAQQSDTILGNRDSNEVWNIAYCTKFLMSEDSVTSFSYGVSMDNDKRIERYYSEYLADNKAFDELVFLLDSACTMGKMYAAEKLLDAQIAGTYQLDEKHFDSISKLFISSEKIVNFRACVGRNLPVNVVSKHYKFHKLLKKARRKAK